MSNVLATFLHLSDLHVGEIDARTGDAMLPLSVRTSYRHHTWLDGLLGHESQALEEISAFIENELRAQGVEPEIIVTGDLSRAGSKESLRLARRFVEDEIALSPPSSRWAGLRAQAAELLIAGNHDHWGDTAPPAGGATTEAWSALFGTNMPPAQTFTARQLANGRRLSFLRIDSDADVAARTPYRTLAIGDFLSELQRFRTLPKPEPEDIRVLLVHHSWAQAGLTLRMSQRSKQALSQFLVDNAICAILTGHSHEPSLVPFVAHGSGQAQRDVFELRCGSSSQYALTPKSWLYGTNQALPMSLMPARGGTNTLLVHTIEQVGQDTFWRAQVYERTVPGPFRVLHHPHAAVMFRV